MSNLRNTSIPRRDADASDDRETLRTQLERDRMPCDFLQALRPGGPWVLTAINPAGSNMGIETSTAHTLDDVRGFLDRHEGRWNLYYSVNPTKLPMSSKAKKADIARVEYVHADLDPRPDESPEQAKDRYLRRLANLRLTGGRKLIPTMIVDSGNGIQALWRLNEPIPPERFPEAEERMLSLTLFLGGTAGTQDVSRILRLPGTLNLPTKKKRELGRTQCRAQWLEGFDGASSYRLEIFPRLRQKPKEPPVDTGSADKGIPPGLMHTIQYGADEGQRSERFFYVVGRLKRLGFSLDQIHTLLEQHPNGIAEKYIAGQRLHREVLRAYEKIEPGEACEASGELDIVNVADVEMRSVEWMWEGRLARRKVTIISGDPFVGKSHIAIDCTARITTGSEWPDGGSAPDGSVVLLAAEDAVDDTIRPRLEAAGANINRVKVLKAVTVANQGKRSFQLQTDLAKLQHAVGDIGDVALVVIDPISSYFGDVDTHQMTKVRPVLEQLAGFAESANVAVLAIHHPPKAATGKAIHAFSGSLAFVAGPRIAFIVAVEPETERRLLLSVGSNIGKDAAGLGYRIAEAHAGRIKTTRLQWDDAPVTVSASEALRAGNGEQSNKQTAAEEFLRDALDDGPRYQTEINTLARQQGISDRTLRRAKDQLHIESFKEGLGLEQHWIWSLPAPRQ